MKKTILLLICTVIIAIQNYAQTASDIDGNVYNTVTIGTQKWFAQNLKTTTFKNGVPIENHTDTSWIHTNTPAYVWYNNNVTNKNIYGGLYNGYAISTGYLCPSGWHVPTDTEWITMIGYLGGETSAINKLKEVGTTHWINPNYGTNESGFTALPGGHREFGGGDFFGINYKAEFWSTTNAYFGTYWAHTMSTILNRQAYDWHNGLSVRCICDTNFSAINENKINNEFQIYPNPAFDNIFVDIPASNSIISVSIYNIEGLLISQHTIQQLNNKIDISNLVKGFYFININTPEGSVVKKFVKE